MHEKCFSEKTYVFWTRLNKNIKKIKINLMFLIDTFEQQHFVETLLTWHPVYYIETFARNMTTVVSFKVRIWHISYKSILFFQNYQKNSSIITRHFTLLNDEVIVSSTSIFVMQFLLTNQRSQLSWGQVNCIFPHKSHDFVTAKTKFLDRFLYKRLPKKTQKRISHLFLFKIRRDKM